MTRSLMILVALLVGLAGPAALAGTVSLPGLGGSTLTFDDSQFVTSYGDSFGTVLTPGYAVGSDLTTYGRVGGENYGTGFSSLVLNFAGDLTNDTGADLWIYEMGWYDDVLVKIGSADAVNYETTPTGVKVNKKDVRFVAIDLDDFGLGSGDTDISSIMIQTQAFDLGWHTPDIGAIAANVIIENNNQKFAVVPLPSSALMGIGLLAVALAGRAIRRRRRA